MSIHNENMCPPDCPELKKPELIMLVGPCGSGKSTLAISYQQNDNVGQYFRINQDEQGKEQHLHNFKLALEDKLNIIVDRMNFSKEQRQRYIEPAKKAGYRTKIIVLHENFETCLERMKNRKDHPTIKDEKTARKVLNFFFSKYERPAPDEADEIEFRYPEGEKPLAIVCDLDGTLCNIDHRLHFVHPPVGKKKDWRSFSESLRTDTVNEWCDAILFQFNQFSNEKIVLCSGRADNYRDLTKDWLKTKVRFYHDNLFMRPRDDYRKDDIVKEIILDFEILTRYKPYFFIDDRKQVVDMWRKRGFVCLQCAEGLF